MGRIEFPGLQNLLFCANMRMYAVEATESELSLSARRLKYRESSRLSMYIYIYNDSQSPR